MGIAPLSWIDWGVWFGGISFKLDTEADYEEVPVIMAKDSDQKYAGMVAAIIGIVVFLLGIVGLFINLFIT